MVSDKTFRVSRIPAHITASHLPDLLARSLGDVKVHVRSLAEAPEIQPSPREQIATVEFDPLPTLFEDSTEENWSVRLNDSDHYLDFDRSFIGFTPLNNVSEENHAFEYGLYY